MRRMFIAFFTIATMLMTAMLSFAESSPTKYALGLGLDIASGTFGTESTSSYATVPVILDWFPSERVDLELTVPLIYQRTTNTGHAVLGTNTLGTAKSVARGMMGGGSGGGMLSGDYGLGDITLTAGYTLLVDGEISPHLRPTLYVKFPTADESKGLGTGAFDFGAGLVASKWFGNWQPFTAGRYVVQGASGAENFITADAGVAYSISDSLVTSLYGRFGSSQFDGMSAPFEARIKTSWRFTEQTYTDVYALKGFSDGSPDYGGGVSVFTEF